MIRILKRELKSLSILALLTLGNQAGAHGLAVPFPIGHRVALSTHTAALNALLVKPSAHSTLALTSTRILGLSGSQSIFKGEVKTYTGQGIIQGIIGQYNQGNISVGQFNGSAYQQLYGDNTTSVFQLVLAVGGNNPLVTNPPPSISNPGATFFSVTPTKGGSAGFISPIRLSGTQRIIQNQLNGIILNGVRVGRTVAITGLTGGFIEGTGYQTVSGNNFIAFGNIGNAFGNSPLNNPLLTTVSSFPNQPSYLNFLNKINIPIGSANLYGRIYNLTTPGTYSFNGTGFFINTAGSNPLNVPTAMAEFNRNIFDSTSYIRLFFKFF
jgi:hypothetical protein